MPELELETVFEAGSPVISPDPSGSMEAEDDDDGCTNSIENGITTKCQIRNGTMRLSADHNISKYELKSEIMCNLISFLFLKEATFSVIFEGLKT